MEHGRAASINVISPAASVTAIVLFDDGFAGELKHGIEPGVVIAFYLIACAVEIDAGGGDGTDLEAAGVAGVNLAVETLLQRPGGEMAADLIDRRQPALICQPPLPWSSFALLL